MKYKSYNDPLLQKRDLESLPIKSAIQKLLKVYRLEKRYKNAVIINSWAEVMGNTVAKRTTNLFIKDKTLFVKINSAPLKSELNMSKTKIVQLLNQHVKEKVLEDIIFL
ncbi:DUF721 domain-containing protein [Rapidithrix thailandica]|uniref:DUF721 domain-containing protein n=1 Tax=Rapidithrix thailandica TaxID=413964 RepID=A0AAW9SA16_9BACT